jgi:HK97 family phage portal protein
MIIRNLLQPRNIATPQPTPVAPLAIYPEYVSSTTTASGRTVTVEGSKSISTAYRCGNIISDDIACMPLQEFRKLGRSAERVQPDAVLRNHAYLMEVAPNRWNVPFIFKKVAALWLMYWGNAYLWQPPSSYREIFVLGADRTWPVFDKNGMLWYQTYFPSGKLVAIPAVEMTHLMINSTDGFIGRSVIEYAAETLGRQIGAHDTQNRIQGKGLNPAAAIYYAGDLNPEARAKIKDSYTAGIEANGLVVFDQKVTKFDTITMKPADAQFLESMTLTDTEIANFFGLPLYKLNQGKQSYQSNEQQNLDYLNTTLNPYLVQWEQVARLRWVPQAEQAFTYWRFERRSLLWMDAKTRSEVQKNRILSGTMQLNEAREIEDDPILPGGDVTLIPTNMATLGPDGEIKVLSGGSGNMQETQGGA